MVGVFSVFRWPSTPLLSIVYSIPFTMQYLLCHTYSAILTLLNLPCTDYPDHFTPQNLLLQNVSFTLPKKIPFKIYSATFTTQHFFCSMYCATFTLQHSIDVTLIISPYKRHSVDVTLLNSLCWCHSVNVTLLMSLRWCHSADVTLLMSLC